MLHRNTSPPIAVVLASLALIACTGGEDPPGGLPQACASDCERGGDLCAAPSETVEHCKNSCACFGEATGVLDCTRMATDCDAFQACWGAAIRSYQGAVSSTCEDFCGACATCQSADAAFMEDDCRDYGTDAASQCMTDCEASSTAQVRMTLSMPVGALSCCELDQVF